MNRQIIIIEDEKEIADLISRFLGQQGFVVHHYGSSEEFLAKPEHDPCIYLVDWNLPGMKGVDLIRNIRRRDKFSPIFMISGYNKDEEVVEGLKSGADDYLIKPFNYDELSVRIENAWSKFSQLQANMPQFGIKLIPEAHSLMREGTILNLTAREYVIFAHLYEHQGHPSTREELISCFDSSEKVAVRNIDVHIFSLRKKLQRVGITVETVWGVGYKIVVEEVKG